VGWTRGASAPPPVAPVFSVVGAVVGAACGSCGIKAAVMNRITSVWLIMRRFRFEECCIWINVEGGRLLLVVWYGVAQVRRLMPRGYRSGTEVVPDPWPPAPGPGLPSRGSSSDLT